MKFRVLKPFRNIDGSFLTVNDYIECDMNRARLLKSNGMIGGLITENKIKIFPKRNEVEKENTVIKTHKRQYRKRKQ